MKKFIFLLIPIFIIISTTELILAIFKPNYIELNSLLGWNVKKNFNHTYIKKNLMGEKYEVNFSTNQFGLRSFKTDINKPSKINFFVFGDSFTSDPYASNDKMWYSEIANHIKKNFRINTSVNAIGAGGYGNLQQLLSIKDLKQSGFNMEEMDFVIFQFCNNDFNNNSRKIEKKLKNYNQFSRRPYLENDKIIYDNSFISFLLRIPFIGESRILNKFFFLLSKIDVNKIKLTKNDYKDSIKVTDKIISSIKDEIGGKKIIIFNCNDSRNWQTDIILKIAKKNKFIYVNFPKEISNNKKYLSIDQSHLSEKGNLFLGKYLFNEISENINLKKLFIN